MFLFLSLLRFVLEQCAKHIKAEIPARSANLHPSLGFFQTVGSPHGKTVNVKLSPEAAPLYRAAAQQYRKLKTLLFYVDCVEERAL